MQVSKAKYSKQQVLTRLNQQVQSHQATAQQALQSAVQSWGYAGATASQRYTQGEFKPAALCSSG